MKVEMNCDLTPAELDEIEFGFQGLCLHTEQFPARHKAARWGMETVFAMRSALRQAIIADYKTYKKERAALKP